MDTTLLHVVLWLPAFGALFTSLVGQRGRARAFALAASGLTLLAATYLMVRYDLRLAALTRGPRGALLMDDRGQDECAAPFLTAVDTVGAGDAFTATLVSGFLRGLPLAEINVHANAVASFVCSQAGATPPLPDHLRPPL